MLIDRINHWAALEPGRSAVIHNGATISYGAFGAAIAAATAVLTEAELPRETVAAVLVANMYQAWVAALAARAAGLHSIAIRGIGQIGSLRIRNLSCVVTVQGEDALDGASPPPGVRIIMLPGDIHIPSGRRTLHERDRSRPVGGHIIYTSGTTGSYKKVFADPAFEALRNERRAGDIGISRDSIFNGVDFGLWTGAGFKQPSATWHAGGTMVFDQRPDFIDHVFDHGVTGASLLPAMFRRLLSRLPQTDTPAYPGVSLFASSGFLPLPLAERIASDITPRLEILYSATELARIPLRGMFAGREDLQWLSRADHARVEVVTEDGAPCGIGEEGFLRVGTGEIDAAAYLDDAEASAAVFRDGCFYPGDMAVRRADGRIRILGRVSDVINLRGNKIAVAPLEQEMQRLLDADDVCIFAHFDEAGREEILVAVEAAVHARRTVLGDAAKRFGGYAVKFAYFKRFPRTEAGTEKVRRLALRTVVIERTRGV